MTPDIAFDRRITWHGSSPSEHGSRAELCFKARRGPETVICRAPLRAILNALHTAATRKGALPLDDYSGLWWDPAEPGWGLSITQSQDNHVFVAWFTYDAQAHPTWMVMPQASWKTAVALEGALYRTQGSAFDAPYDASAFSVEPAGTLHLEFASGGGATATFTVDGQTVVKALRRQPI